MATEIWRRVSLTENAATFASPYHTDKRPELLIVKRAASKTQNRPTVSIVRGDLDVDGNPRAQNDILERVVRHPVVNSATNLGHLSAVEAAMIAHATLLGDLSNGFIPQETSITLSVTRPA